MPARPDASWQLTFNGAPVAVVPGATIAAALVAAGEVAQGVGKDGAPRGLFCGMGVCHDCLVTVDGRAGQRACMTKARDGMRISRSSPLPDIRSGALAPLAELPETIPDIVVDILVVGAGPAGLAAAASARAGGAGVLVLDERSAPGGQFYKQPSTYSAKADRQAREGAALIALVRAAGVEVLSGSFVWGAERDAGGGLAVGCLVEGTARRIHPRRLIVATGAYESGPVLPGWTLPGVMTTGALQTLLRSDGVVPGPRIAVAGNGPLNLQVAAELLSRGVRPAAVIEAAPPPWTRPRETGALLRAGPRLAVAGLRHLALLRQAGIPLLWNSRVVRAEGEDRVTRIVVATDGAAAIHTFTVDLVAVGEGFRPSHELPRLLGCRYRSDGRGGLALDRDPYGTTSQSDILVVGEAGRFGGAAIARAQGVLAGRAAVRTLGFTAPDDDRPALKRLARAEEFQLRLWALFDADAPGLSRATPDTILCRCEALTRSALEHAIVDDGITDLSTLKRLTRAGMGRCQGRYCAEHLQTLVGAHSGERAGFAPQMPLRPVPLVALALERPEWGGHRRSLLPEWRPAAVPVELHGDLHAEVAVIGAGIAGLSTALFLARAGVDVLVLDRAEPNSLASGGNAGSLHGQLLSFDHGARAEAGGGPAARTLPLQRDSIALWTELERELGANFEIKRTGGLMVAETERDLAFLEAKTEVERAQGIVCNLITKADLHRLEPALSEVFIGAAYCPDEGKINPLLATQGILVAAIKAGARLERRAAVTEIGRDAEAFRLQTTRGRVTARRVVNAAGAFASAIGRMLRIDVPVHGAPLQMVVTEPAAPAITCLVAHADRHLTLKQAANGSFLIGGGWTAGLDPVHSHPRPLMASLEGNLWIAQHVVPSLRKLHVLRSWAAMNINIDGAPILGEDPRLPGLFHAVTSNGYTLGPLVGRITADLISRGMTDRNVSDFSIARFERQGRCMIEIRNLTKRYGATTVLKDCSTHVAKGEVVVVCGPSGSGKSTLIKCVNALEAFDGGAILVDGISVGDPATDLPALRARVGMVFQNFELFPHLTIMENLTLAPMKVLGRRSDLATRKGLALLDRVGLADHAMRYPGQLSGGQQQRVAIARALAMDPVAILFDEPTSALDPEMISEVLDVMTLLARDGMTMMCVTHEMGFARRVAHRVLFIDGGTIAEDRPTAEFFGDTASPRAKAFLGRILQH